MWLALDAGNSSVKGGISDNENCLQHTFHLPLPLRSGSWQEALTSHLDGWTITRAGFCSVVPEVTPSLQSAVQKVTGVPAQAIHAEMQFPFTLAYETPGTLGTDRLAAAAGAWTRYGTSQRSMIIIDGGTAVTCDVIDHRGVFCGGAIGASPSLLRRALREGTAQLPDLPFHLPRSPLGTSTQKALQSGLMYGFIDSTCGMIDRLDETLPDAPVIVATGGWSSFLQQHVPAIDQTDAHLVLHGVRAILERNPLAGKQKS